MTMGEDIQAVTFGLGAETFAVPVAYVKEILDFRDIFQIPGGPDYLLGLTELRGEGVTTIDFRLRLGLPKAEVTPSTRVLVVEVPLPDRRLLLGLVVDQVLDVSTFHHDQLDSAPDIGTQWPSHYIEGIVRRPEGFVVLIDVPAIFTADDDASHLMAAPIA